MACTYCMEHKSQVQSRIDNLHATSSMELGTGRALKFVGIFCSIMLSSPTHHHGINTLGGSCVTDLSDRLRPLYELYRPHLLLSITCRASTYCVQGTNCIHIGFAAPDKKLSFLFTPRFHCLFTFATPKYSGATSLHYYSKFTQTLGVAPLLRYHKYIQLLGEFLFLGFGFILFGSVDLFSLDYWIGFLWLIIGSLI
jgi:hypothetical protein